jgi:hypothetical protein
LPAILVSTAEAEGDKDTVKTERENEKGRKRKM